MVVGKQDSDKQEKQTELVSCKMYKNKLKMIKDLNVGHETINILGENISSVIFDISLSNIFLICFLRQKKSKNKQMEIQQTKKLLHS